LKTAKTISKKSREHSSVGGNNVVFTPDPEKQKIASAMVYGSVIKRRNEQSINWYMLMLGTLTLVFIPLWWISSIVKKSELATLRKETRAIQYSQITNEINNAQSTRVSVDSPLGAASLPTIPANPIPNITINVIQPTPGSTSTPTPPAPYSPLMMFRYSYYNPKLGGINCAQWDDVQQDCVSTLANGEDWHVNYGKALACPPDIALGSILQVVYPPELVGLWECKDRGGMITGDLLDFLDVARRVEWASPVAAYVNPPETPLQQINNGSH
jgi:hypothetical protein